MSQKVPVFDHTVSRVVFREKRAMVLKLVERGVLFVVSDSPFEAAFVRASTASCESKSIGPAVIRRAAAGGERSRQAVESRRTIQMRFKRNPNDKNETAKTHSFVVSQNGVSEELISRIHDGAILYFPNAGPLTNKRKDQRVQ